MAGSGRGERQCRLKRRLGQVVGADQLATDLRAPALSAQMQEVPAAS